MVAYAFAHSTQQWTLEIEVSMGHLARSLSEQQQKVRLSGEEFILLKSQLGILLINTHTDI